MKYLFLAIHYSYKIFIKNVDLCNFYVIITYVMIKAVGSTYSIDFLKKALVLKKFWNDRDKKLNPAGKGIGIKKQKILFFYNVFSKINNKDYSFEHLKAFKDGPIFNDVYFQVASQNIFVENIDIPEFIISNEEEYKVAETLVSALTPKQLSDLSHQYNCWKNKYDSNYLEKVDSHDMTSNNILPEDFDEHDELITKSLFSYFRILNCNYILHKSKNNVIAIKRSDYEKVKNDYLDVLDNIEEVINPVRIEIEDGGVVIDY